MGFINLQSLAKIGALKTKKIPVPELGNDAYVCIREMNGEGSTEIMVESATGALSTNGVRKLFKYSIANEDGSLMLKNGEEVTAFLDAIPNSVFQMLLKEITEFNHMGNIEEQAKN